ncbi:KAP family P-loop NTPase fold protein [Serratia sp. 22264]|uniref:KAP family P-loop NTPase fold protein n=1 Tax=Serratia sp. 22264 TaxID=3453897 RepID=UPI003F839D16
MKNLVELPFEWHSESDGFPADNLDRAKYARFLTDFLVAKGREKNYVLNVNASWGAGKTWFLRRWSEEIKKNYPVVFVDAWKSDHSKDPFLSVVSAISKDLEPLIDVKFKDSAITKKSWLLLKSIAPELTKGIVKKYLSLDIDEVSKAINNNDASSIAGVGAKAVEKLIKFHDETNSSIDDFKEATSKYLDLIVNKSDKELPLFIFIDELDRCRPTYAIEMLETIKHIFDMDKVVFVIATDKGQLQHSIKAVYGNGFNSTKYLDRFFDRSVTLRKSSLSEYIASLVSTSEILSVYLGDSKSCWTLTVESKNDIQEKICWLAIVSEVFNMDLRTVKQWVDRLEASINSSGDRVDFIFLSYLLALNSVSSNGYDIVANANSSFTGEMKRTYFNELLIEANDDGNIIKFAMDCTVIGIDIPIPRSGMSVRNPLRIEVFESSIHEYFFNIFSILISGDIDSSINNRRGYFADRLMNEAGGARVINFDVVNLVACINSKGMSMEDYFDIVELATILE